MRKPVLCLALAAGLSGCGPETPQEIDSHLYEMTYTDDGTHGMMVRLTASSLEEAAGPIFKAMKWQMEHGKKDIVHITVGISTTKVTSGSDIVVGYDVDDLKTVNWADDGPAGESGMVFGLARVSSVKGEGPAMVTNFCQNRTGSAYERFCAEAKARIW